MKENTDTQTRKWRVQNEQNSLLGIFVNFPLIFKDSNKGQYPHYIRIKLTVISNPTCKFDHHFNIIP